MAGKSQNVASAATAAVTRRLAGVNLTFLLLSSLCKVFLVVASQSAEVCILLADQRGVALDILCSLPSRALNIASYVALALAILIVVVILILTRNKYNIFWSLHGPIG